MPHTTYQEPGGATIGQVLGPLETIDRALPVTSAFIGEHLGGDEKDTAAVAPVPATSIEGGRRTSCCTAPLQPVGGRQTMTVEPGYGVPAGRAGATRASDADRERAVDVLSAAFAEGRLTREEHGARVQRAYGALIHAELAELSADLPAGPRGTPAAAAVIIPQINPMAVASLACGLIPLLPATIAAITLGIGAHRQIRRTGGRGTALATAGLVLGLLWLVLTVIVVVVF